MRLVRRYLFRAIVSMTAIVMLVLLSLGGFIEFVGQLDDIGTGDYGMLQAIFYTLMRLPGLAFVLLPMAALLGALLGLGGLAAHSELIALRAAGISVMRLARAVLATGAFLFVVTLVIGEYVAPPLDRYARQYRTLEKFGQSGLTDMESAWIRDGRVILNVTRLSDDYLFGGVYLYRTDGNGRMASIGRADSAGLDGDDQWMLNNYQETRFNEGGVVSWRAPRLSQVNNLNPDLLGLTVVRADTLGGPALYRYVQYLKRNGLDARRYESTFWNRIASAVAVAPMCVLALPFAFGRLRSSGSGGRMMVGIIVGLAFFIANRALSDGAQVYDLNVVLVAWLPTFLLSVVTVAALARFR